MELIEALKSKQEKILTLWIERTLNSYAAPAFFKAGKDPFANPVGSNIASGLTSLYQLLLTSDDLQDYIKPLDQVTRIRAVQDFTPSQAVAPFLELKWVIRQVLAADKDCRPLLGEMDTFDCSIDRMVLAAFDIYTQCREQLYQNRIRELKTGSAVLTDAACPSALARQTENNSSLTI